MKPVTGATLKAWAIVAAAGLAPGAAVAQPFWTVNRAGVTIDTGASAIEGCMQIGDFPPGASIGAFRSLGNGEYIAVVTTAARDAAFCPGLSVVVADALGRVRLRGAGTRTVTLSWDLITQTNSATKENLLGRCMTSLVASMTPEIGGLPPNTPVIVDYRWKQMGSMFTESEHLVCGGPPPLAEGPFDVAGLSGTLDLDGFEVLGGRFNILPPPGTYLGFFNQLDFSGTFNRRAGDTVPVSVDQDTFADIFFAGKGLFCGQDTGHAVLRGSVTMSVSVPSDPQGPPDDGCDVGFVEFSVDIGGDAEFSDPGADGDEVFDPGDMYMRSAAVNPGPFDGLWDDQFLFGGVDPQPDPTTGTVARPCVGQHFRQFALDNFDLDGHDAIDQVLTLPNGALDAPIDRFDSENIFEVEYLTISFDDDNSTHAAMCDIPATTPISPPLPGHGTATERDEVVGVNLVPIVPMSAAMTFPIWHEEDVHANMAPNPVGPFDDDDVDALDIRPETQKGTLYWYFSADHEANSANRLDPGDVYVYDAAAGGVVPVVDDVAHLGVADSTDLRDFEFGWIYAPNQFPDNWKLVLVFAVAPDDPVTPADESGGLDSKMLYYSFFTGASYPLLSAPVDYDIDAVALYCSPLPGAVQRPCKPDLSGSADPLNPAYGVPDGQVDSSDFFYFLDQFVAGNAAVADLSGSSNPNDPLYGVPDGQVDASDFFYFLDIFVAGCP